jgi:hypothetical protein
MIELEVADTSNPLAGMIDIPGQPRAGRWAAA